MGVKNDMSDRSARTNVDDHSDHSTRVDDHSDHSTRVDDNSKVDARQNTNIDDHSKVDARQYNIDIKGGNDDDNIKKLLIELLDKVEQLDKGGTVDPFRDNPLAKEPTNVLHQPSVIDGPRKQALWA